MPEPRDIPPHSIAIIGMAGRFPGAADLDEFWRNVRDGVEALTNFSDDELDAAGVPAALRADPNYVRKGTVLQGADEFDAAFFGLSPREAQVLDPQHRIFLECAWEALEHAGYGGVGSRQAVGVYAGAGMNTYLLTQVMRDPALAEAVGGYQLMLGNDKDFLCTRVSYKLDLRGPSMAIQTACSTSLVAVEIACRALQSGECDMALAGGVSVMFPQRAGYLYQEGMILSPDGHCRPFDAEARGTRAGAGAGIVVLKRLAAALADGDTVHAVISGIAVNNDGAGKAGYTAPSVDGQVEVIAMAQAMARVEARNVSYVEAHGTATPLGDPIEIAALTQVFRASTPDVGFCRLGSLKANLGHLDAAAGVAGLIKTVLALRHQTLPPLLNYRTANPQLNLERSPFLASSESAVWPDEGGRVAGVSSFGIGGTNAHAVVQEAPALPTSRRSRNVHLLVLSAKTATALDNSTARLAAHLREHPAQCLDDVAWTLQAGRQSFSYRRAVVVGDATEAVGALTNHRVGLSSMHEGGERPVAFLFSGQGSQHPGMGAELYRQEPVYRDLVDRCAALLETRLGLDLRKPMLGDGAGTGIHETQLAQPALFVTELALATLWMSRGVKPSAMLGHSIGEYVAAHLAGVMSLDDALAVVAERGKLMQSLPRGSMATVQMDADELAPQLADGVEIAAINAPGLCTVSGGSSEVSELLRRLSSRGVDAKPLRASHAFHSAMMDAALEPFVKAFDGVQLAQPSIPYISNVTGTWITPEQATSPDYYAGHLRSTVRFADGLRSLAADPALCMLEVGPGQALTTLARSTLVKETGRVIASMPRAAGGDGEARALLDATGRLWLAGVAIDWQELYPLAKPRRVALPTYPFERVPHVIGRAVGAKVADAPGASAVTFNRPDLSDWFFAPTWMRSDADAATVRLNGTWLILGDAGSLAEDLMSALRETGANAVGIMRGPCFEKLAEGRFSVRPEAADDYAAVLNELHKRHDGHAEVGVAGVMHLSQLRGQGSRAEDDQSAAEELIALATALAPFSERREVMVLHATAGAESVLDEPIRQPHAAVALGAILVLPQEVPGLRMRLVDVEWRDRRIDGQAVVRALIREAGLADGESIVAYRAGRRWLRRFADVTVTGAVGLTPPLRQEGVYLITGGLGGLGLAFARWLGKVAAARLLLTARTTLPARECWSDWLAQHPTNGRDAVAIQAIREIEASGGVVLTAAADASDEAAMSAAISEAMQRWGRLDGVIHAAGVPGSGTIALRRSADEGRTVLAPKVQGLEVLVRLLGHTELDFVALMSSINAVIGAAGAVDYTSANAFLDAFPASTLRPERWRRVIAVNWSAWRDVGMAAKLAMPRSRRDQWLAYLASAIPPAAGVEALARGLASGRERLVVAPYDVPRALESLRGGGKPEADDQVNAMVASSAQSLGVVADPLEPRPERTSAFEAPASDDERRIAAIWSELLGIERIGVHDDFFEIGGHSLMATRVLARISDTFGVRLALRDVFDAPTIHQLAQLLMAHAPTAQPSPAASAAQGEREEIEF
jgi:acyl transferase domain-containing protein